MFVKRASRIGKTVTVSPKDTDGDADDDEELANLPVD